MIKRITFKQFLFILPLLLILAVFSVFPILSSFVYTAFDYRPTDPTRASLFLSESFNSGGFHEDGFFLTFFLGDVAFEVPTDEGAAEVAAIQQYVDDFIVRFYGEDVRRITNSEIAEINEFIDSLDVRLTAFYVRYSDTEFFRKDDTFTLIESMRRRFIEPNFIGLENYRSLIQDSRFLSALRITLTFTFISVFFELVLGMALALIMNRAIRGIGIVRTVALIPWAIPTAVAALMWSYLYDGSSGIVAHIFSQVGLIESPQTMLLTASGAMASAILADVWKTTPYMALLLLSGLQIIDSGLYESAAIDGSGRIKTFTKITLPLMKSSILVALLFRMLDAFRVYDLIAVLTGGGPGGATETLSIYAHRLMIGMNDFGYGSTVVIAMFVCVAIIAFFFVKVLGAEIFKNE
ncbi:MAG: sugar ABC transporter permease [Defluviitaleaceae bacterium]|nr:sugar ABC transporter permease [Defluviitaleaceae bacterium]